jgi:hypothetical protein
LPVIRKVNCSSARASLGVVNTNNRVGGATRSRVTIATLVMVEAYVSAS